MRSVSPKRARLNRVRKRNVIAAFGTDPVCAARGQLEGVDCEGWACDAHEVKTRGRGGSITDTANIVPLCRPCHDWITAHPQVAWERGWVLHSWESA